MNLSPRRIGIVGFEGVTGFHLTASADVFAAATLNDGYGNRIRCYEVSVIGLNAAPFRAESGVTFRPGNTLRTVPALDTIIVPGGPGILVGDTKRIIASWLRRRVPTTRRIASLCSGTFALASTGLLDGREVTADPKFAQNLAMRFPTLKIDHSKTCVRDGSFYTASGTMAGLDLSQQLVMEDFGPEVATWAQRDVALHVADPRGEHIARTSHFVDQSADHFAELISWILRNLDEDLSVEALARKASMCPSILNRNFKAVFGTTPGAFVQNLRLHEARRRLSTKRKALHSIARSVGFSDPKTFGAAFERRFGVKATASAFA